MRKKDGSLRIIAGQFRGRKIKTISTIGTRPMTDRVRENLFNILGIDVIRSRFLDIFAGSGAVGIEAFSRGASSVVFIELNRKWSAVIDENVEMLDLESVTENLRGDAYEIVSLLASQRDSFDIIFVGAPYHENHHNLMLQKIIEAGICKEDGQIVLQYKQGDVLDLPDGFEVKTRNYGITDLSFLSLIND